LIIPDNAVVIIRQDHVTVRELGLSDNMVIYAARTGFPGIYDKVALAHRDSIDNPHSDSLQNIKLPGSHGGKWFKIGAGGVVITEEIPLYQEDIRPVVSEDSLVRADKNGPNRTLADLSAYPLCITDALRLRGDFSKKEISIAVKHSTEKYVIGYDSFEQPVLNANGTVGGSSFAVAVSSTYTAGTVYGYCATNPSDGFRWQSRNGYAMPQWLTLYNPVGLRPVAFEFNNDGISAGESNYMLGTYQIQASNDNSTWVTLGTFTNTCTTPQAAGTWRNEVQTDDYYKYFRIYVTKTYGNTTPVMIGYCRIITNDPITVDANIPNNRVFDCSKKIPQRMFYGTDTAGNVGFRLVPGKQVIP